MKKLVIVIVGLFLLLSCNRKEEDLADNSTGYSGPVRLLPDNPHYLEYHGKPMVLVTSAEHYGALLNEAFDYKRYLETLARDGMNYTRIFGGTYAEIPGESFGIKYNTLAPQPESFLTPWAVTINGSGKRIYDLDRWNDEYFKRLHEIMRIAGEKGIVVELTLFTSIYRDEHWDISPQNPENNSNIEHPLTRFQAHTLTNGDLLGYQEKLVRKLVRELNDYDHFFFEIQNEPWSDHNVPVYNIVNKEELRPDDWQFKADFATNESMEWQERIAGFITDEESGLEKKHLIAQNFCNFKAPLPEVPDYVSIINFHYNWPETAWWNYHFNRVIGFDESGFAGPGDKVYRRQAWRFILSGGGLFNNLDYSFFCGYEDGTLKNQAPGGGSTELRNQLRILSEFIHSFDLAKMHPDRLCVLKAPGMLTFVLSDPGNAYAIFTQAVTISEGKLIMEIPEGNYRCEALSTFDGETVNSFVISSDGKPVAIDIPFIEGEIVVKIVRR